jgi:hypothetical protein
LNGNYISIHSVSITSDVGPVLFVTCRLTQTGGRITNSSVVGDIGEWEKKITANILVRIKTKRYYELD